MQRKSTQLVVGLLLVALEILARRLVSKVAAIEGAGGVVEERKVECSCLVRLVILQPLSYLRCIAQAPEIR